MKYPFKNLLTHTGIVCLSLSLISITSCKKEIAESTPQSPTTKSSNLSSEPIANLLDKFWANYSAIKGVTTESTTPPTLNSFLSESEMLTTLHYSLNTALTEVDTTYEEVTITSFNNDITLSNETQFKNEDICLFFDKVLKSISEHTHSSEIIEKKIHEVNLEIRSYNETSVTIRTTVKFSSGELYATSDLDWTGAYSPYLTKFTSTYSIPWVSKTTAEQGKEASGYGKYNYFNFLLNNNWSITTSGIGTIQAKLSNDKAAHDILSSNALYWPNPNSTVVSVPTNRKIVPSGEKINGKETMIPLINKEETMGDPSKNITPLDVVVYCGNPSTPNQSQGSEGAYDIQPSALLSYYNSEHHFGLTDFRSVNGSQMNFFWKNRDRIIRVAFSKKATEINSKLNTFNFGFYAVSELKYVAQAWPSRGEINQCYFINCPPGKTWTMCHFQEDYRPDVVFKHYSYQPLPPAQWRELQKLVL